MRPSIKELIKSTIRMARGGHYPIRLASYLRAQPPLASVTKDIFLGVRNTFKSDLIGYTNATTPHLDCLPALALDFST